MDDDDNDNDDSKTAAGTTATDTTTALPTTASPQLHVKTVFHELEAKEALKSLVIIVSVFARYAPQQKEAAIAAFNDARKFTLMCNDGTTDIG
eukprot:217243-Ditylum_brightwellii.AAC.1